MRENFSKGIRKVLKLAKEEAVRLAHSYVGSEHLLLGIIKDDKGRASLMLKSIGVDISEMKTSNVNNNLSSSKKEEINIKLQQILIKMRNLAKL